MDQYHIADFGTVNLSPHDMRCNFQGSSYLFFKKFRKEILTLPQSVITALKTAIDKKDTPISYHFRYQKTLENFFISVKMKETNINSTSDIDISLTEFTSKSKKFRDQIEERLNFLTKNQFHEFINNENIRKLAMQNNANAPNEIVDPFIISSMKQIATDIDNTNLDSAQNKMSIVMKSIHHYFIPPQLKEKLSLCHNFIQLNHKSHQLDILIEKHDLCEAKLLLNYIEKEFDSTKLNTMNYSIFSKNLSEYSQEINFLFQNYHNSINSDINLIVEKLSELNFDSLNEIIQKNLDYARKYDFKEASHILENLASEAIISQKIWNSLDKFSKMSISRIHLNEIAEDTGINVMIIKEKIPQYLATDHFPFSFDKTTNGIEFHKFQNEIDQLLDEFKNWDNQKKKSNI